MAYYAASSPPLPKAPSLAPTDRTGSSPSATQPEEKSKVKGLMKRAFKELAGGGGNNNNVQSKGAPVVRPYGRGGVGAKLKGKDSGNGNALQKTSSKSPDSSVVNITSPAQYNKSQLPASREQARYDAEPTDDGESVISSIPAPKRTQQWINQLASLPSPPDSNVGTPPAPSSTYHSSSPSSRGYNAYPSSPPGTSPYQPSQYSDAHQASYRYSETHYATSPRARALHSVDEDGVSPELEDQFGRLGWGPARPSSSLASPQERRAVESRSPAGFHSPRFSPATEPGEEQYDTRAHPSASPPPPSHYSQLAAQVAQRYTLAHGRPPPQSIVDQYIAAAAAQARSPGLPLPVASPSLQPVALQSQTRELQSQIEGLRDQERRARERLEALRRESETRSSSSGGSVSASRREPPLELVSPRPNTTSTARTQSPIPGASSQSMHWSNPRPTTQGGYGVSSPTGERPPTAEFVDSQRTPPPSALLEKERLRQRDLEREREAVVAPQPGTPYLPSHADPYMAVVQHQQHQQLQALLRGAASPPPPVQAPPQPVMSTSVGGLIPPAGTYQGVDNQQQLIMQLGALLLQQQQQLQLLTVANANRAAASPPPLSIPPLSDGANQPTLLSAAPGLPALGGLDLNSLLALAAIQQQQQQQQQAAQMQGQAQAQGPPTLVTSPPSEDHGSRGRTSPRSSTQATPSPSVTESRESSTAPSAAPSSSQADAKYREAMGLTSHSNAGNGTGATGPSMARTGPPRTEPPRIPLPEVPQVPGASNNHNVLGPRPMPTTGRSSSNSVSSQHSTPPPAYIQTPR